MPAKRIIPCLDVAKGRVVKGVNFKSLEESGDPVELAISYETQGADELVILDIEANVIGISMLLELIKSVAPLLSIPLCVGGGIHSIELVTELMQAGADKVSLCTAALKQPKLIKDIARIYGSQCVVVSIDAKRQGNTWTCYAHGGRVNTGITVEAWAKKVQELGAGEILLNSIDRDGTGAGYDLKLIEHVAHACSLPLIASSGAGRVEHLKDALAPGRADAVLVAGLLHRGTMTIGAIKEYLAKEGVEVRC